MENILSLKNVSKGFDDRAKNNVFALKDINLDIYAGEFFVFVGPSGSGKSTLLRIMSGLEKEYEGKVEFGAARKNSFIFQQFALMPWLTVLENVQLGLLSGESDKGKITLKAMAELKKMGLEKFANAYVRELSGGMKQRVGIARALVVDPDIIFMDEPFSELDSFTAEELRKEVLNIWEERKPTIVMVTHIIEEAVELAERIAVLTPQPGKIEKIVENRLPRPRNKRSKDFYDLEDQLYRLIKP